MVIVILVSALHFLLFELLPSSLVFHPSVHLCQHWCWLLFLRAYQKVADISKFQSGGGLGISLEGTQHAQGKEIKINCKIMETTVHSNIAWTFYLTHGKKLGYVICFIYMCNVINSLYFSLHVVCLVWLSWWTFSMLHSVKHPCESSYRYMHSSLCHWPMKWKSVLY